MSQPLLPLTTEISSTENTVDLDLDLGYTYNCWQNESYDSDFLVSCLVSMVIFVYVHFADYIAKKYTN